MNAALKGLEVDGGNESMKAIAKKIEEEIAKVGLNFI